MHIDNYRDDVIIVKCPYNFIQFQFEGDS